MHLCETDNDEAYQKTVIHEVNVDIAKCETQGELRKLGERLAELPCRWLHDAVRRRYGRELGHLQCHEST